MKDLDWYKAEYLRYRMLNAVLTESLGDAIKLLHSWALNSGCDLDKDGAEDGPKFRELVKLYRTANDSQ